MQDIKHTNNSKENLKEVKINYHKLSLVLLFASALLLLSVGVYRILQNKNTNNTSTNNQNIIENQISTTTTQNFETEKIKFEDKKDWYRASYEYPKGNEVVKSKIENTFKDWIKENEGDIPELKKIDSDINYSFTAEYKTALSSSTKTYIYNIYSFTGGAHGSLSPLPLIFSTDGKELSVEDILPMSKLQKVSEIAFVELQKQRRNKLFEQKLTSKEVSEILKDTSWIKEGTAPTRDNYNAVWLDGDYLVIYFGQYQVASYAEGDFEVRIPRSEI